MPSISFVRSTKMEIDFVRIMQQRNGFPELEAGGLGSRKLTFDAGLPYRVSVSETRDDVVADGEGKLQPVMATFLQGKPHALGVRSHRKWEDNVRPSGRDDRKAQNVNLGLQGFYEKEK